MVEDRPENLEPEDSAFTSDPLISQDELDRAIVLAREAARKERETAPTPEPAAPQEPFALPVSNEPLPPDLGVLHQDELNDAIERHFHPAEPTSSPIAAGETGQTLDSLDLPIEPVDGVGQDEIDEMLRAIGGRDTEGSLFEATAAGLGDNDPETSDLGQSVLSQDELDRALEESRDARAQARADSTAHRAASNDVAPTAPASIPPDTLPSDLGPISQRELDSAVEAHENGGAAHPPETLQSAADTRDDAGVADQDEIDRMLQAVRERESLPEPAPSENPETISQDEIDLVLSAERTADTVSEPVTDDYGQLDQDAIDRLIRQATGEVTAKHEAGAEPEQSDEHGESVPAETDTQSGTGTLQQEVPAAEQPEFQPTPEISRMDDTPEDQTLAQDDIDGLLAALSDTGAESPKRDAGTDSVVNQNGQAEPDNPPSPETVGDENEQLGQAELDQLLAAFSSDDSLVNQDLDDRLTQGSANDNSDMDAEVAPQGTSQESRPDDVRAEERSEPLRGEPARDEDPVTRAERGAAESQVGSENLAAAVPETDELIESIIGSAGAKPSPGKSVEPTGIDDLGIPSTDELVQAIADGAPSPVPAGRDDMVVQLGEDELAEVDVQASAEPSQEAEVESDPVVRKNFRRSFLKNLRSRLGGVTDSGSLKTWASLAAGVLFAVGTFLYLQSNRHRLPDLSLMPTADYGDMDAVARNARQLIDMEEYKEAESLLEPVVKDRRPSPSLAELEYLYLESRYRQLPSHITDQEAESMHRDIDELVAMAPTFEGVPELLRWKAGLYERSGALAAALSTYRGLTTDYVDQNHGDETLIRAARLANEMKRPEESQEFLVRLLQRFPASPYAPEAKLLLGDAQRDAGKLEDAETLYAQVAMSQDFSPIGADATARLAQIKFDQGQYADAIRDLERRLETATTVEGNDAIYLLLAKAYRANGDPAKAEGILRELINFFPESPLTPEAFIELSQTLDALGNRKEALRMASHASQRFAENPAVLINEGELQQREGNDADAAKVYLEAVDAGSGNPATLLAAGNAFTRVNELAKARQTFDRLVTEFPTAPEAFDGNIALAQVLQKQGQSQAALERLTNLAEASAGKPQQISLQLALGDLYSELGFRDRAAAQYEAAAAVTDDETVLAKSAAALLEAGDTGSGLAIARRVDAPGLTPKLAYDFLTGYARALLQMDAAMALEKMEQAYNAYPDQRTERGDRDLLNAYLVMGQTARARALVMDLSGYVRKNPGEGPRLQRTAIQWADALFARSDYTAAAEAYALAVDAAPDGEDAAWARFQQANALMELDDYGQSLELLDAVAASSTSFAEDARLKAEYARLEQRLRGEQPPAQLGG